MDSILQMKAQGVLCYAVEQTEQSILLHHFTLQTGERYALVLGNEVDGVDQGVIDACHGTIEIKQFGTKHSLNVAVCGGIVLHELLKTG
jgi:tRNA G18 (ribose-2'-O)-methylase SpoU